MLQPSSHWVFTWLDRHGIRNVSEAESKLAEWRSFDELKELALGAHKQSAPQILSHETAILAARGLDLSGRLSCAHIECRKKEVDKLFRRVWHYFDTIVVDDFMTHRLATHWNRPSKEFEHWFLENLSLILYVRETGADQLIQFHEKPHFCENHSRQLFQDVGLGDPKTVVAPLESELFKKGKVERAKRNDNRQVYAFSHPLCESVHIRSGKLMTNESFAEIRKRFAHEDSEYLSASLALDMYVSQQLCIPLGSSVPAYEFLLRRINRAATQEEVAFNIELPTLEGATVADLIELRRSERESFERFQHCLRLALAEYVKAQDVEEARRVAEEVRRDVIEPEVRKIRDSLATAAEVFRKKSLVGTGLGTLATLVGISVGVPVIPAAASAAVAMAGMGTAAYGAYAEEERKVKLSDMWFAWKALGH